ncbi:MAG: RNA methyltransferase [Alphaproteobacteria bacterium]|nr:RNA methyltransferase [Alphaproteobacteria bacterium]NCQ66400.1 RNA methyltransferase [Alphaproteobacteria bacterium]NCT06885.1 RNA methyltransferase [Alphaproteobacteria bacterium]
MNYKPVVILSRPTLSQNIGACARAMLNFGLTEMRLIDPQANWLDSDARALSASADRVLEKAVVFKTAQEAFADLQGVYATTARPRDMIKEAISPREAAVEVNAFVNSGKKVGLLFGSEKCGLDNDEIALCDKIITVPLNPDFSSINLAQAVILISYEMYQGRRDAPARDVLWERDDQEAPREELFAFYEHLEGALEIGGYFQVDHKRDLMQRNLRNMFARASLTSQEVRSLRGVIAALTRSAQSSGK